jgi:hypothetical protein
MKLPSTRLAAIVLVLLTGCGGTAFEAGLLGAGDAASDAASDSAQGVEASAPDGDTADARGGEDQGEAAGDARQDTSIASDGASDAGLDAVSDAGHLDAADAAEVGVVSYCCDVQGQAPKACSGGNYLCNVLSPDAAIPDYQGCSVQFPCAVGVSCITSVNPNVYGTVQPCH